MHRRDFLTLAGTAGAALALGVDAPSAHAQQQDFTFLFLTDTHIQPELDAAKGCDMAFRKMRTIKADFAIQGGDHVFDSLEVPTSRALSLFDLYNKTEQDLGMKVHHAIGNHDVLGIYPKSGVSPSDPLYGKKTFEDRMGARYRSFDHKGVHFIILDSIFITSDRAYEGRIEADQLSWLDADLKKVPAGTPVIVTSHIPVVSAYEQYLPPSPKPSAHHGLTVANSAEVIKTFEGHNVLAVLQGHTHVNEVVTWKGVQYITSGAVSGNWWKGTHMGSPEGYTVVTVSSGKLSTRYETYGFRATVREDS